MKQILILLPKFWGFSEKSRELTGLECGDFLLFGLLFGWLFVRVIFEKRGSSDQSLQSSVWRIQKSRKMLKRLVCLKKGQPRKRVTDRSLSM